MPLETFLKKIEMINIYPKLLTVLIQFNNQNQMIGFYFYLYILID